MINGLVLYVDFSYAFYFFIVNNRGWSIIYEAVHLNNVWNKGARLACSNGNPKLIFFWGTMKTWEWYCNLTYPIRGELQNYHLNLMCVIKLIKRVDRIIIKPLIGVPRGPLSCEWVIIKTLLPVRRS